MLDYIFQRAPKNNGTLQLIPDMVVWMNLTTTGRAPLHLTLLGSGASSTDRAGGERGKFDQCKWVQLSAKSRGTPHRPDLGFMR